MPILKTAFELEQIVADSVGFDRKVIVVSKAGDDGGFSATVTSPTAWLTRATAQSEVDKACVKLRTKYALKA